MEINNSPGDALESREISACLKILQTKYHPQILVRMFLRVNAITKEINCSGTAEIIHQAT